MLLGLCLIDGGSLLTFRLENLALLLSFARQDDGTLVALCLHLLLHSREHALRRHDVLQLYTVHLDTPLVGGIVEHGTQLRVDGVARGQRLVEFHLTNDVTQCRLRQLLDSIRQVVDFVYRLERVDDLEIQQRIDLHLDVILGNHVLTVEVIHLFAQVDAAGIGIASVLDRHNLLGMVDEGDDKVNTWVQGSIILTQSLHNFSL